MPWGALAGAVVGGVLNNRAADKAADAQGRGADASINEQRRQFDLTRQDQAPWLQAGQWGLQNMQRLLTGDPSAFYQSPDYQFAFDEGLSAIDQSAAARGGLFGGGHSKDLVKYGQGMATQNYNNYYSKLANMAGLGQSTATNLGNLGMGMASNIGNAYMNKGGAQANAYQQQGQNWADLATGAGNLFAYYNQRNQWGGI